MNLPRWTALLALPLLAGALLLMHGLDAGAHTGGLRGAAAAVPTDPHRDEAPAQRHDVGCDGCAVGHVMAACVATVVTVVGLRLARRTTGARVSTLVDSAAARVRAVRQLPRPPDPAWVRLAVVRC